MILLRVSLRSSYIKKLMHLIFYKIDVEDNVYYVSMVLFIYTITSSLDLESEKFFLIT